jgi:Protein of unknown function (DUF3895)
LSQIKLDLFAEEKAETVPSASPLQHDILALLHSEEISTLKICQKLIESGLLPKEFYSTGKPKAYGQVCSILDSFVLQGKLIFVQDIEKKDRIYSLP